MVEKEPLQAEDLAQWEAALAEREAQLAQEQAEFEAYKAAKENGSNPNPADYGIKNAKESLYDKIPITVKQLDVFIGVMVGILVLIILFGADWPALLGS